MESSNIQSYCGGYRNQCHEVAHAYQYFIPQFGTFSPSLESLSKKFRIEFVLNCCAQKQCLGILVNKPCCTARLRGCGPR